MKKEGKNLGITGGIDIINVSDCIKTISSLIENKYACIDINDLREIFKDCSESYIGTTTKEGKNRALDAIKEIVDSIETTTDIVNIKSAIVSIFSSKRDSEETETNVICNYLKENTTNDINLKCQTQLDETLKDSIKVSVIVNVSN